MSGRDGGSARQLMGEGGRGVKGGGGGRVGARGRRPAPPTGLISPAVRQAGAAAQRYRRAAGKFTRQSSESK